MGGSRDQRKEKFIFLDVEAKQRAIYLHKESIIVDSLRLSDKAR